MLRSGSLSCGLLEPVDPRYWGKIEDFLENCVTSVMYVGLWIVGGQLLRNGWGCRNKDLLLLFDPHFSSIAGDEF